MAPSCLLVFLVFLMPVVMLAAAANGQGGKDYCSPTVCGNLTISSPFGMVSGEATETSCGELGFQVYCFGNNTPYLHQRWQILNIFYDKASVLVVDSVKLHKVFNTSGNDGCHAPFLNISAKLGGPFSISPVNQNLIFYNCTKTLGEEVREKNGLVETVCRNNTFVRAEGHYDDVSSRYGDYFLEGCNATVAPVLVKSGKANANNYMELLRDGFLLTWQAPSSPPLPVFPAATFKSFNCNTTGGSSSPPCGSLPAATSAAAPEARTAARRPRACITVARVGLAADLVRRPSHWTVARVGLVAGLMRRPSHWTGGSHAGDELFDRETSGPTTSRREGGARRRVTSIDAGAR
ncbi:unnamed protein product [Urochloa humidicola]